MQDLCKKAVLIMNSVLLTVIGLGIAAVGGVLRFHTEMLNGYLIPIVKLLPSGSFTGTDVWTLYNYTAISLIGLGIIIGSLGILGCWISTCPKLELIIVHMLIVAMLILGQAIATTLIATTNIGDGIQETLRTNLLDHYAGDENVTDEYSIAWNYMFVEFSCCGSDNSNDFLSTKEWNRSKTDENGTKYFLEIPVTCCKLPEKYPDFGDPIQENCTMTPTHENSYFQESCYIKLYEYLWYYGVLMCIPCGVTIMFEAISLATLTGMCLEIKRKRNKIQQACM